MKEAIEVLTKLLEDAKKSHWQIKEENTYVIVSTRARLLGKIQAYERAIEEIKRYTD